MKIKVRPANPHVGIRADPGGKAVDIHVNPGGIEPVPEYQGDYVVDPLLDVDQTLETQGKKMTDDVTIKGMEVKIVHNESGGLTYYIGE